MAKKQRENGSLTVEACLSLTIFVMVFFTLLYIIRIVFAYGIVQHSLNQAAKELSSYSYFYSVAGANDINKQIQNSTSAGRAKFDKDVSNVITAYHSLSSFSEDITDTYHQASSGDAAATFESLKGLSDDFGEAKAAVKNAAGTIKSIAEDPIAAIKAVGSVLLNGGNEIAKTWICGEITRHLMAKYISDGGFDDADSRLVKLRIVDGLDGLDFSASRFWSEGATDDLYFVACYTIDPIFPIKIMDKVNLVNTVRVRGWSGKSIF